jgi:hypothetical protein
MNRTDPPLPRRADVAEGYDRGAKAYEALWSPVILPPAAALVRILGLTSRCVVADVGAGTGALLSVIRHQRHHRPQVRPLSRRWQTPLTLHSVTRNR